MESTITVVNWSDYQHTAEVPYTEDFREFKRNVCWELNETVVSWVKKRHWMID